MNDFLSAEQRKRLYWFNFDFWGIENKNKNFQSILESGVAYYEKAHCLTATYYKSALSDTIIKNKRDYVAIPKNDGEFEIKDKKIIFRGEERKINLSNGRYDFRKLTPIECERLQGLPDDYTNAEGLSNSQRYKMIGNAWQVDTIIEIFKELK